MSTSKHASGLLALAIRRPIGVSMVVLALLLFGFVGYTKLPVTLLPDLSYPTITVRTEYPGASPEDIEDRVSEPIREAVSVLSKVVRVTSISRAGQSDVIIEFSWGAEMLYAVGDVREKVDRVFLPREAEKPLYLRYDPSLDPIMTIGLSGGLSGAEASEDALDMMEIRDLVEDDVKRELQEVEGVAAVKVKGGDEKEILIAVDPVKLSALDLDIRDIARRIGAENLNASAGILEEGKTEYLVRALNEFGNLEEIRKLIVARRGSTNIYLSEVGRVQRAPREKEVITRIDGKPAVLVEVFKEADANLVALAGRVHERLFGTAEQRSYVADLERRRNARKQSPRKKTPTKEPMDASASTKESGKAGETEDAGEEGSAGKERSTGDPGDETRRDEKEKKRKDSEKRKDDWDKGALIRHGRLTDYIAYRLPKGTDARVLSNPATYIENSIHEVLASAVLGGLFAVLVIFLFLRSGRPTFLISLAIPISLLITFAPLHLSRITLNVMSLGGLALGVGMLVDTSIVVLESISRCREEGDGLVEAALRGVQQVKGAVIASTLTTVAVFLPIVFVEGIAGQLFRDQALAVVFSLLASLGVSLFLIPMLASRGSLAAAPADPPPVRGVMTALIRPLDFVCRWSGRGFVLLAGCVRILIGWLLVPFVWLFGLLYRPLEAAYPGALRLALANRPVVLLLAGTLAVFAGYRATRLGSEVLPEVHEGQFEALVFLARDVDVERTDEVARPLERRIRQLPGVQSTFLTSGTARDELRSSEEGRHSARIHIVLEQGPGMPVREEAARRQVREILDTEPAVQGFRFQTPTLFSIRTPISIEVLGHDMRDLMTASQAVAARLERLPNLSDIRSTLNRGNTEVVVRFDRERLAEVGLDIGEATRRLAAMVQGEVPTRFAETEKKVDMRVRLDPERLSSVRALGLTDLAGGARIPILLSSVAELRFVEGPSEIRRLDSRRGAEIQATLVGLDLGRVQGTIEQAMETVALPDGVELRFGGQREEMERSRSSMVEAMLLAIFLVYVVMAAQFESLVQPFIIIFSVPLALIGVVLSLDLLEIPISVIVFIGAIMLAGIVVNNAIVLLDRINQERAGGKSTLDAVVDGAGVRFRPVLMTTMTTILGLLPLTGVLGSIPLFGTAGEGVELRAPMAITVITGLGFSTLLTLIVIPVTYAVVVRDRRIESPVPEA